MKNLTQMPLEPDLPYGKELVVSKVPQVQRSPAASLVVARGTASGTPERPVRREHPEKVRMGFIPDSWFKAFYPKTGVTGPYMFGAGLVTYLCSKEIYIMEHEFYNGISLAIMVIFAVKKLGPAIAKFADEGIDKIEAEYSEGRNNDIKALTDAIEDEKKEQWRAEGQKLLMEAKKENIQLQLEAAYRERLAQVYSEVKRRLDYQVERQNAERRIAQRHQVAWIVNNVLKSITPDQEKATINQCIVDLGQLAAKAKLSERNCVEVVTLLIEKGLIDVIFTNDGKEYLTNDQLEKEINDELYVSGGRINLVDLSRNLNVDLQRVTTAAERVVEENASIRMILGQLIDESYIQRIATEINEKLAQMGELNVADITVSYDLPSDFLMREVLEKYLGTLIFGKQDISNPRIFFTQSYVQRCKAKIRGALSGITVPTPVSAILSQAGLKERIFFTLIREVHVQGSLTSRSVDAQYIPHIYTKMQSDWVKSFYKQNGYLELSLSGLGVSDPKTFIQSQLTGEKYKQLNSVIVDQRTIDQVSSSLEECISTSSYLDISTIVPQTFTEKDFDQLISLCLTPTMRKATLLFGSTIITLKYLDDLIKPCHEVVKEKAKEAVDSGRYQQYIMEKQLSQVKNQEKDDITDNVKMDKREERRKKAAGGAQGGGAQGRETKTKSTKKHNRNQRKQESDSEDENDIQVSNKKKKDPTFNLINTNDIKKVIVKPLEEEGLEDLAGEIAAHFFPQLSKTALNLTHELFESTQQNKTQNRRHTHAALQDKLNTLINDIRLYEKGLKLFSADFQPQLIKYLLKSLGTDICNELATYIANESNLATNGNPLTPEQRLKISQECEKEYKSSLQTLIKSLQGTSIDEFLTAAETCLQACSMILKKVDKKKDRTLILCHKHELLEQLSNATDPALVLHLTVLIIFTIATGNILHASGRHVSAIMSFLQTHISSEQSKVLMEYHDLVLKMLSSENSEEAKIELERLESGIKEIAQTFKKPGVVQAE
uniref:E3 UFM1-protein ligase 1 homolog n=1 Tax=Culicoides sonorensis TaxID=179676 RepID=A0A336LPR7_CULSO